MAMLDLVPLFMGIEWLDPEWLLGQFGQEFLWICLLILFVECGLFFPFLPGDALLFAIGVFVGTADIDLFPGHRWVELVVVMVLLIAAGFAGNVTGYEIGRKLGPRLYQHDGALLKRKHLLQTELFFSKHGAKALVIGRFVAFVRTYITVIAGVTAMHRGRFYLWSFVGAVLWVLSIVWLGYVLGSRIPWLGDNIDYVLLGIIGIGTVLTVGEARRRRQRERKERRASAASESR